MLTELEGTVLSGPEGPTATRRGSNENSQAASSLRELLIPVTQEWQFVRLGFGCCEHRFCQLSGWFSHIGPVLAKGLKATYVLMDYLMTRSPARLP